MDNLIERLGFILRFHDIRNQPYIEIKHQLLIDTYDRLVELEAGIREHSEGAE